MKEYKLWNFFMVKPLINNKTAKKNFIHTNASRKCIFHSINLKFCEEAINSICKGSI